SCGKILKARFGKVGYSLKGRADLLTAADLASQKKAIGLIRRHYPDHGLLAEEGVDTFRPGRPAWIIDPLDGTTNYAHGFPAAAVTAAYYDGTEIKAGGTLDPFRGELFFAVKGRGASLNGRRIKVSRTPELSRSLLATGFAYDRGEKAEYYCSFYAEFLKISHDIRRMGSAALDLAWTACGRLDGYWEFNLKPWDVAAGLLLVKEAGGEVSDFSGKGWKVPTDFGPQTLAANGRLNRAMLSVIREKLRQGSPRSSLPARRRAASDRA
ncbi:MAG: inositol monophosphatase family protein, partial [Elusimicrobiales bacterium]|nr:inositol monophosphatase family protein [Elusimicrobiales bacterium]